MILPVSFSSANLYLQRRGAGMQSVCPRGFQPDTVSFKSTNLLTKSSDEIAEAVISAVEDEDNYIAQGKEGKVYRIPDTEYCVKILRGSDLNYKDWKKNVYPSEEVNHIMAKADNGDVIMRYIEGETLHYGKEPEVIYDLPEQSFRRLLKQICNANKKHMVFDNNPPNIIYNAEDKSLTAIDFYDEDYERCYEISPFSQVFKCLRAKSTSAEDKQLNRKLGGKLLNIIVDDLSAQKPFEIFMNQRDINNLFNDISWSQSLDLPPQFNILQQSVNSLYEMRNGKLRGRCTPQDMNREMKISKCLINQILSE
ncbi:MAG: hypothetical protein K6E29_02930 [Cyanobacteria bacterium RUI128]|nr:hypothetical protein [Cyanobacteria bacterium RUI128]